MSVLLLVLAAVLTVLAGGLASVDAAISAFSRARAEELDEEGRGGAARLASILDDPARYINSVLLLRIVAETAAVVLFAVVVIGAVGTGWAKVLLAVVVMIVLAGSFVPASVNTSRHI